MIKLHVTDRDGLVREIEAEESQLLMEALREFDWGVPAICGGMCSCATCHVYLDDAWTEAFPEPDYDEEDLVDTLEYKKPQSRLSCQLTLGEKHDGLVLTLAPEE